MRYTLQHGVIRRAKSKIIALTSAAAFLLAGSAGTISVIMNGSASALPATIVSTPSNTQGWAAQDGTPTYVAGPAGADGNGSLKLTTDVQAKQNYFHGANTPLSGVSGLGYSMYDTSGVPASYQLQIIGANRIDNPASGSTFTSLVWEPVYNGQVNGPNGGFVTESNLENGIWWSSNPIAGAPNRSTFVPLSTIIAQNPGATIIAYGVNVGSGTPNATSFVDDVAFMTDVTNFELDTPAVPTGLRFENPSNVCGATTSVNHTSSTWNAATGAASYNYHVDGPNGLTYDTNTTNTQVTGSFGSGDEGTYTFKVQSVSADGITSAFSAGCSITYDPTPSPTDKDQCKNDGWKSLFDNNNKPFKNQGQCVSYVNGRGQ
jgi:hypothetical protein